MSEQDKSLLDEQASLVRAVYRALPDEEIPAELDLSILENAAAAIGPSSSRPGLKWSWLQWSGPLASAAVVLLVVAVVMQPQSQREMVPAQVAVSSQYSAPPPAVPDVPRMAAEKPNLTAIPKELEEVRMQAREPGALADRAPQPAALSKPAPATPKREEGGGRALVMPEGSLVLQESSERERDLQSRDLQSRASAQETGVPSAAADASGSARAAPAVETMFRKELRRAAPPAAAPVAANTVDPALDISPALRVRLEKFSSERQKAGASAADATLDELRREYPGVDIDAALRALEQMRVEGAN